MTLWSETVALMIGARVRDQRVLALGWTQQRLADELGLPRPVVARLERGVHLPGLETICQYAHALRMDPRELLACVDEMGPP